VNITLFSSNQPRHLNLTKQLSDISDNLYFISEVTTVFPGKINDFYKKSEVMERYFTHVIEAEQKIFGHIGFLPSNVKMLSLKSGDLNLVSIHSFPLH
jgi:hypothetical protein